MASPLVWKIYDREGDLVASTKFAEDAASVVSNVLGGVVKRDGRIVWREGKEEFPAGESYDQAAGEMYHRVRLHHEARLARLQAHSAASRASLKEYFNGTPH